LLHYTIAFGVVTAFFILTRNIPILLRRPVISGMIYGIAVYFAMGYLIVPLSAVPKLSFSVSGMITGILIHMFCVGMPAALVVRARSISSQ
jgi:membrane associated rhomboid family serine protease